MFEKACWIAALVAMFDVVLVSFVQHSTLTTFRQGRRGTELRRGRADNAIPGHVQLKKKYEKKEEKEGKKMREKTSKCLYCM